MGLLPRWVAGRWNIFGADSWPIQRGIGKNKLSDKQLFISNIKLFYVHSCFCSEKKMSVGLPSKSPAYSVLFMGHFFISFFIDKLIFYLLKCWLLWELKLFIQQHLTNGKTCHLICLQHFHDCILMRMRVTKKYLNHTLKLLFKKAFINVHAYCQWVLSILLIFGFYCELVKCFLVPLHVFFPSSFRVYNVYGPLFACKASIYIVLIFFLWCRLTFLELFTTCM